MKIRISLIFAYKNRRFGRAAPQVNENFLAPHRGGGGRLESSATPKPRGAHQRTHAGIVHTHNFVKGPNYQHNYRISLDCRAQIGCNQKGTHVLLYIIFYTQAFVML